MRSTPRSILPWILLCMTVAAGCGREAPARPGVEAAAERPVELWGTVAPDSLYGATAIENLRLVPVELELRGIPRGWDGMRVAVLSDLQLGLWPDNPQVAEAAVRRAVDANPDLVVLLGDYLAVGERAAELERVLEPLRGRPALAVLGDRDLRSDTVAAAVEAALRRRGVTVLRNRIVAFALGTDTAYIAGIDPAFATFAPAQQAELFADLPEGAATPLLLSHLPAVLPRLPEKRFPAVFAGHTVCGDVEVPGTPRLARLHEETLQAQRVPRANRLFRGGGNTLFVTCGVGYSFLPARFGGVPEVAIVTLLRMPEAAPAGDTLPAPGATR